jgi:hypothetical protein
MDLICIDVEQYINITVGVKYSLAPRDIISNNSKENYWIIDDFGKIRKIDKKCFLTIEEWRDRQLCNIGL